MNSFTLDNRALIAIREFELMVEIGIHDFEQHVKQRLLVDVDVWIKNDQDHQEDINNTYDYDYIANTLRRLSQRKYNLQETLAKDILHSCFYSELALEASVYVRKTDVYKDCGSVGVKMSGRR